jgi:hypothetical protein
MRLVTVATHSERYFPYLKQSAEKHGHDLVVLGWGEKWQGFTWKFQLMREYLKTVPDDEVVCFVDGYDVIVLEGPQEIEQKFRQLVGQDTNRIVISKETIPEDFVGNAYVYAMQAAIFQKCKDQFLNTGTYIGTAKTLRKIYSELCSEFDCKADKDDQILLQNFCQVKKDYFFPDSNSHIFLVLNDTLRQLKVGTNGLSVEKGSVRYNGVKPSILHAPGNTDMDDVVEKLGYDPSIFSAKNELMVRLRYVLRAIKHFGFILLKQYGWIFLVVFAVVAFYIYGMPTKGRRIGRRR